MTIQFPCPRLDRRRGCLQQNGGSVDYVWLIGVMPGLRPDEEMGDRKESNSLDCININTLFHDDKTSTR